MPLFPFRPTTWGRPPPASAADPTTFEMSQEEFLLLMATIADLTAAVAAHDAAFATLNGDLQQLFSDISALEAAFTALKNNPASGLSAADQTALDAAVADVSASTAAVQASAANVSSADAGVTSANPPAPAP